MRLRQLLRAPLFHFVLIGTVLFAIGVLRGNRSSGDVERSITIDSSQVINLIEGWRRTWQRPPTEQELVGLIDDFLKEEIYYREAIALGLDRDDAIIRRRLRQKVEFLTDDISQTIAPTDADLERFLEEHADDYRLDPIFTLAHRYFNADRRGDEGFNDAQGAVERLGELSGGDADNPVGDPLPLPTLWRDASERDLAMAFGPEFAQGVSDASVGAWQGPIRSGFGFHVVFVEERIDGRLPALAEVRSEVERDWRFARQNEVGDQLFQGLRDQYDISVQWPQALKAMEER